MQSDSDTGSGAGGPVRGAGTHSALGFGSLGTSGVLAGYKHAGIDLGSSLDARFALHLGSSDGEAEDEDELSGDNLAVVRVDADSEATTVGTQPGSRVSTGSAGPGPSKHVTPGPGANPTAPVSSKPGLLSSPASPSQEGAAHQAVPATGASSIAATRSVLAGPSRSEGFASGFHHHRHPDLHHSGSRRDTSDLRRGTCVSMPLPGGRGDIRVPPFVFRLWSMLSERGHAAIVHWAPAGRSFVVEDEAAFASAVLPRYFVNPSLAAFKRTCSLYGIHPVAVARVSSRHRTVTQRRGFCLP